MNDKIIWKMWITWLLLSLGLLFHSVCSETETTTAVTAAIGVTKDPAGDGVTVKGSSDGSLELRLSTTPTTGTVKNTPNPPVTTGADVSGEVGKSAASGTTKKQTDVLTSPTVHDPVPMTTTTAPSATTPTERPATTLLPPSTIKSITSQATIVIPFLIHATPDAAAAAAATATHQTVKPTQTTPAPAYSTAQATVTHISAELPQAVTTPKPKMSSPSPVFVTTARPITPDSPDKVGTTQITTVTTKPTRSGQHTTVHSTISPKVSKGVEVTEETVKTTTSAAAHTQASAKTTEPSWITVTPDLLTGTSKKEATSAQAASVTPFPPKTTTTTTRATQTSTFVFSLNERHERKDDKNLAEVCRRIMADMHDGNCTLTLVEHKGKTVINSADISGKVKTSLANHYYEEITKKSGDNTTLIAILASCGALLAMIIGLAIYASHHRKPYNETQQHLTEELHTVENGYHDNPTLEVMEVQPEMQEKKVALNGEFNDSWIVPIDNLLKEDIPDEEDTHL